MKYCSKCGTPAEDNQNFCLNCGSRLTTPVAQAAAETAQQAAAAASTVQDQFAAQQQQTATAAQNVQAQLAETQAAAAAQAAQAAQQQQAAQAAAAQVAATAEAQQAAQAAAAQVKSEAEAQAKAAANQAAQQQAAQQAVQPAVQAAQAVPQAVQTAVPQAVVPQNAVSQAPDGGEKKKGGMGKWLAIIGFALVAVVLIIILLLNVFGSSYRTPLKKMISAMNSRSMNSEDYYSSYPKIVGKFSEDAIKTAKEGYTLAGQPESIENLDDFDFGKNMVYELDDFEAQAGKNLKFSYDITSKKELDAAALRSIAAQYRTIATNLKTQSDLLMTGESQTKLKLVKKGVKAKDADDYCDKAAEVMLNAAKTFAEMDETAITAGYELQIRLNYKGNKDETYRTRTYRVLKINGKWVFDINHPNSALQTTDIYDLVEELKLNN